MELLEAIQHRRSIRAFLNQDLPKNILKKLLSAAIMAPSAGNLQSWEFVIIQNLKTKRAIADAAFNQHFISTAPLIIVACANTTRSVQRYGNRGRELYCIQECAAAVQNLLLVAYSLGLGACWVGAFNESMVSKLLDLPMDIRPVALIPLGYAAHDPSPPPRLPLERVLHYERY